jgi:2-hydroxymuconate-semialdehyde hydrolase
MDNMRRIMDIFAFDRTRITEDIVRSATRRASSPVPRKPSRPCSRPAPALGHALASAEEAIQAIPHETLIIHGREDRVIPFPIPCACAS